MTHDQIGYEPYRVRRRYNAMLYGSRGVGRVTRQHRVHSKATSRRHPCKVLCRPVCVTLHAGKPSPGRTHARLVVEGCAASRLAARGGGEDTLSKKIYRRDPAPMVAGHDRLNSRGARYCSVFEFHIHDGTLYYLDFRFYWFPTCSDSNMLPAGTLYRLRTSPLYHISCSNTI